MSNDGSQAALLSQKKSIVKKKNAKVQRGFALGFDASLEPKEAGPQDLNKAASQLEKIKEEAYGTRNPDDMTATENQASVKPTYTKNLSHKSSGAASS